MQLFDTAGMDDFIIKKSKTSKNESLKDVSKTIVRMEGEPKPNKSPHRPSSSTTSTSTDSNSFDPSKNSALYALSTEDGVMARHMGLQTLRAARDADLVLLMFDGRAGVLAQIVDLTKWLRRNGELNHSNMGSNKQKHKQKQKQKHNQKQILLVANKLEGDGWSGNEHTLDLLEEVGRLGFGEPVLISAEHGDGMADIAVAIHNAASYKFDMEDELKRLEALADAEDEDYKPDVGVALDEIELDVEFDDDDDDNNDDLEPTKPVSMAIIGRQNVGKSTLLNSMVADNRVVVGSTPGLTRDSISVDHFDVTSNRKVVIVDTAGIRKASKRNHQNDIETMSVEDATRSMKLAHVAVLVLDASEGQLTKLEMGIVDQVIQEGRALVIVANKYDLLEADLQIHEYAQQVKNQVDQLLPHVGDTYVVAMSALKDQYVDQLIPVVLEVYRKWDSRINTGKLNEWLKEMVMSHPPPSFNRRPVRLKYITQVSKRPPSYRIFSNVAEKDIGASYLRFLRNGMRAHFGLQGMALRFHVKKQDPEKNPFGGGRLGRGERAKRSEPVTRQLNIYYSSQVRSGTSSCGEQGEEGSKLKIQRVAINRSQFCKVLNKMCLTPPPPPDTPLYVYVALQNNWKRPRLLLAITLEPPLRVHVCNNSYPLPDAQPPLGLDGRRLELKGYLCLLPRRASSFIRLRDEVVRRNAVKFYFKGSPPTHLRVVQADAAAHNFSMGKQRGIGINGNGLPLLLAWKLE